MCRGRSLWAMRWRRRSRRGWGLLGSMFNWLNGQVAGEPAKPILPIAAASESGDSGGTGKRRFCGGRVGGAGGATLA
jgi:hypothetical protein